MLKPWLAVLRLPNGLIAAGGVLLGHLCLRDGSSWHGMAMGSASLFLLAAAGNAHNDVLDIDADRINRPERSLPSGSLERAQALALAAALFAASLVLAAALDGARTALVLGMGGLLFAYNRLLKRLPLAGNLAVALLCALAIYFPELPALPRATLVPMVFAFLTTVAREILKDAEDMPGDMAAGFRTLPVAWGPSRTRAALLALVGATLALLPWPLWRLPRPAAYAAVAAAAALPPLLLVLAELLRAQPAWGRAQRRMKWAMVGGMTAIAAGVI